MVRYTTNCGSASAGCGYVWAIVGCASLVYSSLCWLQALSAGRYSCVDFPGLKCLRNRPGSGRDKVYAFQRAGDTVLFMDKSRTVTFDKGSGQRLATFNVGMMGCAITNGKVLAGSVFPDSFNIYDLRTGRHLKRMHHSMLGESHVAFTETHFLNVYMVCHTVMDRECTSTLCTWLAGSYTQAKKRKELGTRAPSSNHALFWDENRAQKIQTGLPFAN